MGETGTLEERFARRLSRPDASGCVLWKGTRTSHGYGQIKCRGVFMLAHRLAWQLANGSIPEGLLVCHHCDVKLCVNAGHLFTGTHKDNSDDMIAKGRDRHDIVPFGEGHYRAKLNQAAVLAIRKRARSGEDQKEIAKDFGILQPHVSRILNGRAWKRIDG